MLESSTKSSKTDLNSSVAMVVTLDMEASEATEIVPQIDPTLTAGVTIRMADATTAVGTVEVTIILQHQTRAVL